MANLEMQLIKSYRLTTAEIYYHLPDYPELLQSYIWQEYDYAPKFPVLHGFLDLWTNNIEGKIHSVYVAKKELVSAGDARYGHHVFTLQ